LKLCLFPSPSLFLLKLCPFLFRHYPFLCRHRQIQSRFPSPPRFP